MRVPPVIQSRTIASLTALFALCLALSPTQSRAEWWKIYAPKDYEDCATSAEQPGLSKQDKAKILSGCDAKFAGRRKPGGGYTYFDFMQNRSFDIAGPNPTPEELKRMDQEYLGYLGDRGHETIVAAVTQPAPAPIELPKAILSPPKGVASVAALPTPKPRPAAASRAHKEPVCKADALSCGWAKITTTVHDLFQPPQHKPTPRKPLQQAQR
ncbi:hypothetical protein [Bradyrhizobium sp. SYSU BS000235]|uniref:hypothetical protein n=1 Tax=Bradyrhizobium sp. SYSU BS000235 TaxID=3411332 RepID=UPI003C772E80